MPGKSGSSGLVKVANLYEPRAGGKSVMSGPGVGLARLLGMDRFVVMNNSYRKNPGDPAWILYATKDSQQQSQGAPAPQPGGFPAPQVPVPNAPQAPAPAQQDPVDQTAGVPPGGDYPESWE